MLRERVFRMSMYRTPSSNLPSFTATGAPALRRRTKKKCNWVLIAQILLQIAFVAFVISIIRRRNISVEDELKATADDLTTYGNSLLGIQAPTPVPTPAPVITEPPTKRAVQPPLATGLVGVSCRYEGHCGTGTTCMGDPKNEIGGTCESYTSTKFVPEYNPSIKMDNCYSTCIDEIQAEEAFKFNSAIQIIASGKTEYYCLLRYKRNGTAPSIEPKKYTELTYNNRTLRVDPVPNTPHTFTAMCEVPCRRDCRKGFLCRDSICVRDEGFWFTTNAEKNDMTIVTASTKETFKGLENLAASVRYWAPEHKLIIYNLGLEENQIEKIRQWHSTILRWPNGIPQIFPTHVYNVKNFAWKPIIINETLYAHKNILWVDAGSTLTSPIDDAEELTRRHGIFLTKEPSTSTDAIQPEKLSYFGHSPGSLPQGELFSPVIQGYLMPSKYYESIVLPSAECALDKQCFLAGKDGDSTHGNDQLVLSMLAYREDLHTTHFSEYVTMDRRTLSSNLDRASSTLLWISHNGNRHYVDKGY